MIPFFSESVIEFVFYLNCSALLATSYMKIWAKYRQTVFSIKTITTDKNPLFCYEYNLHIIHRVRDVFVISACRVMVAETISLVII